MRGILCTQWGKPEALELADLPTVSPGPGEVRLKVEASGVNFADLLTIAGRYQENPPLPFVPGFEVAGTIDAVGADVRGWQRGDRVMGMLPHGGYAEAAVLSADQVFTVPESLTMAQAAGFPVAYGTAYGALAWRARLLPAERVLVFGAAGGVGLAAVSIARILGGEVIAVASGSERLDHAARHGAVHTIDRERDDVATRVLEITHGRGVDIVLDPVGGDAFDTALRCLASEGRLVVVGFASGTVGTLSAGVALGKNIDLIGCYWGAYRDRDADRVRRAYAELGRWADAGKLNPHVGRCLPLAEARQALALLQDRAVAGKIVLTP
ncbi:NADPH:quinone oxidoreductase family protein [Marinivivus vitaminiproducens]|uniref:NADPH:quinone oxidoreductase family protein n=1 Tax=Marinivivus vitaminiproducens TaxID=3035935 RepID=UPI0027AA82A4|nr:NADPH:quinone oxidoreductase family protein [Geminicoccaceae bacterium SCSIO 64248]